MGSRAIEAGKLKLAAARSRGAVARCVCAGIAALLLGPAPAGAQAQGNETEKILFARTSDSFTPSYLTMDPDGSEAKAFWTDQQRGSAGPTLAAPSLDPDVGRLAKAVVSTLEGTTTRGADLDITAVDLASGRTREIAEGNNFDVAPDGKSIVYRKPGPDDPFSDDGTLESVLITSIDGADTRTLFSSERNPTPEEAGTGNCDAHLPGDAPGSGYSHVFSPDGSEIAYVGRRDMDPAPQEGTDWNCDIERDIYVTDRAGSAERLAVDLPDSTDPTDLSPDSIGWKPDGSGFVLEASTSDSAGNLSYDVYSAAIGGSVQKLTTDGDSFQPSASPDGSEIAFVRDYFGDPEVWVMDAGGGNERRLASGESPEWVSAPDTDEDGIIDLWEEHGIDENGDGDLGDREDVDLPTMGADPERRDVFVEVDHMPGDELRSDAARMVIDAFDDAPVHNPDGSRGISLHIDNGADSTMDPLTGATWGQRSESNEIAHRNKFGDADATTATALFADLQETKEAHFQDGDPTPGDGKAEVARRAVFHYAVLTHELALPPKFEGVVGISRFSPGSDFELGMGAEYCSGGGHRCRDSSDRVPGGDDFTFRQASVFMHELGHNLGLGHGGADHIHRKPNYLSVMNYLFGKGLVRAGRGRKGRNYTGPDYSRIRLDLNESAVRDRAGFPGASGTWAEGHLSLISCEAKGRSIVTVRSAPTDFDCDGNPRERASRALDLNGDGGETVLRGHDDWNNLVYDGGVIGAFATGTTLPRRAPIGEQPWERPQGAFAECRGKAATLVAAPGKITRGTAGRDVIVGTPGHDVIRARGGRDLVCGGGGKDKLAGGGGRDKLLGGGGRDKLGGGAGRDKLGGQGGNDKLLGGGGRDKLVGGRGNDKLGGGGGGDKLGGRGGNDKLVGGGGRDKLVGGGGRDRLNAADGRRDRRLTCGAGRDRAVVDRRDPRPRRCERVHRR